MSDHDIYYWAARAAEERGIVASLPDGPPAAVHRKLADLYEQVLRRYAYEYQARNVADDTDQLEFADLIKSPMSQPTSEL